MLATALALSPVLFVLIMDARELRPWWRQMKQIRALPETHPLRTVSLDHAAVVAGSARSDRAST